MLPRPMHKMRSSSTGDLNKTAEHDSSNCSPTASSPWRARRSPLHSTRRHSSTTSTSPRSHGQRRPRPAPAPLPAEHGRGPAGPSAAPRRGALLRAASGPGTPRLKLQAFPGTALRLTLFLKLYFRPEK